MNKRTEFGEIKENTFILICPTPCGNTCYHSKWHIRKEHCISCYTQKRFNTCPECREATIEEMLEI